MSKRKEISPQEVKKIEIVRKTNKDKTIDKWLEVLLLHAEGKKRKEIAAKTGYKEQYVSELVREYCKVGLAEFARKQYKGNHRNMSLTEEKAFLEPYKEAAEAGQIVEASEIEAAYKEIVGHSISSGQIYRLLHRHGWRKVMPRSKHPNKASEEAIEASKKCSRLAESPR